MLKKIISSCVKNPIIINTITVLILVFGLIKGLNMNKEAFPAVDFKNVVVSTIYPGASPRDVELFVTDPIEKEIATVAGIEEMRGSSIEGRSSIIVKLDPDENEDEVRDIINNITRAVARVSDLPNDLPNPPTVIEMESARFPIITVSLSGDLGYEELDRQADIIAERLERISDVSSVVRLGDREKEFWVEVNPEKLDRYNISLGQVVDTLKKRNVNLPGGALQTQDKEFLVRTVGEVNSSEQISNIIIRANAAGIKVRIQDIGTVKETFADTSYAYRANQKPAVMMNVLKSVDGDAIRLVDEVKKNVKSYLKTQKNHSFTVEYINDISEFVRNRLGVLTNNGIIGIILVLIVLLVTLSFGIASVAAMGMPIALVGTFIFMSFFGMSVNLLSMFGMIIVLGILVDDAIIVAENIWYHYENGKSAYDATIIGTSEVVIPVSATILTTIAAFSPLMMMSGIMGSFISQMPKVVIMALASSWFEAIFILPSHAFDALKLSEHFSNRKIKKEIDKGFEKKPSKMQFIMDAYEALLRFSLKFRFSFVAAMIIFSIFTFFVQFKYSGFVLFPPDGVEQFFVRADMEPGKSIEETMREMKKIEKIIAELPKEELKTVTTTVGIQQNDPNDPFTGRGKNLGEIKVFLTPENDRIRTANVIMEDLRKTIEEEIKNSPLRNFRMQRAQQGPPVGRPVAVRISGDDFKILDKIIDQYKVELANIKGVSDIESNFKEGKKEIQIHIDEIKAAAYLLTADTIAFHVRTALDGSIASYVRSGGTRQAIRVRFDERHKKDMPTLAKIKVPNQLGNMVALSKVAEFVQKPGVVKIDHFDRKRTITVSAELDTKISNSTKVNEQLAGLTKKLQVKHPEVTITQGGEYEDTAKSMKSLQEAFIMALAAIFLILTTLFGSLSQPIVVMMAIPFGIIGVIWATFLHGMPISFFSMVGTIGLSGVVVNDSIVLVDFLNKSRAAGLNVMDAAIAAGKRRFRAVWLTTLTTVCGLVPLVYGIGGSDKFLVPAAIALGYGLLFSTILILVLIPTLYIHQVDLMVAFQAIFTKSKPKHSN